MKKLFLIQVLLTLFSCQKKIIYPLQENNINDVTGIIYLSGSSDYVIKDKEKIQTLHKKNLHFKEKMQFSSAREQLIIVIKKENSTNDTLEYYTLPSSSSLKVEGLNRKDWLSHYFTKCEAKVEPVKTNGKKPFFRLVHENIIINYYETEKIDKE